MPIIDQPTTLRSPWDVDRWGRLLVGVVALSGSVLAAVHHHAWLALVMVQAVGLIVTSITDRCLVRALVLRLGARRREDLFFPGGQPRGL